MSKTKLWFLISSALVLLIIVLIWTQNLPFRRHKVNLPVPPEFSQLPDAMAKQIRKADKSAGRNPSSDNLGSLGMIYHSNTFYEQAQECYLLAISQKPEEWKWPFFLGYLYSEMGDAQNAIKYFRTAKRLNPVYPYISYYLGESYAVSGKNEEAEDILKKLIARLKTEPRSSGLKDNNLFPLIAYSQFRLARLYQSMAKSDSALEILKELTGEHQDFGPAFRLLSTLYSQIGEEHLSQDNLLRANELYPFVQPQDTLIDQLGMISRSPEYLFKQIDRYTIVSPPWAKKLFEHALFIFPDNRDLVSKGAVLFLNFGFENNLTELLNKHITMFSDDIEELKTIASIAFDKHKFKLSSIYLEKCLKIAPGDFTVRSRLSIAYLRTGNMADFLRILKEFETEAPDSVEVLSSAAAGYLIIGDKINASRLIDKMEDLVPDNPKIFHHKAQLALLNRDTLMADKYYLKALNAYPDGLEFLEYLGKRYIEQGLWQKAIHHYETGLQQLPYEPILLERLGDLLTNCPDPRFQNLKRGRYYNERVFYCMSATMNARISAGKNLGKIYFQDNEMEKAIRVMDKTIYMAKMSKYSENDINELMDTKQSYQSIHEYSKYLKQEKSQSDNN